MNVLIERFLSEGAQIKGIIHVGTNDFYELQFYRKFGIKNVIGFEPLIDAISAFQKKYPKEEWGNVIELALSDVYGMREFNQTSDDGQGSSLLMPTVQYHIDHPEYAIVKKQVVSVNRFDKWYLRDSRINIGNYNCLVVDTQGTELQVLKGFGIYLRQLQYIIVEVSERPNYIHQATFTEINEYMIDNGFRLVDATNNDAFYERKDQ